MQVLLPVQGGWTPFWLLMGAAFLIALILAWAPGGRRGLIAGAFVLLGAAIFGSGLFDPRQAEPALPVEGGWTPYGLLMAGGVVGGLALTRALFGLRSMKAGIAAALGGLLMGHITWGLVMIDFLDAFAEPGWLFFFQLWQGGSTLYGAVAGALLGVAAYHLATRVKGRDRLLPLFDSLAPGACLAIAAGRAAEVFNGQGIGAEVANPALRFFPLSVCTLADEDFAVWQVCVWFWEALAALLLLGALLAVLLRARRRQRPLPEGRLAGILLIVLACSQIFLEQLRRDDALKFGFVISFTQIAAAVTLAGTMAVRAIRRRGLSARDLLRCGTVAAGILTMIFAEFVIDKPQFGTALSIALLAQLALFAALLLWAPRSALPRRAPAAILPLAAGIAFAVLLGKLDENVEVLLIYAVMALTMTVTCIAALRFGREGEPLLTRRRRKAAA